MRSHRQLFPTSSLPTNDSVCPDHLCLDPDCPFGDCSPYPDPPSSSLIPPPPTSDQAFQISPLVIVVIALISALVILISYYFIALRKRTPPVRRNAPEENTQIESQLDGDNDDDHRLVDHHIWLINTVGLQQSVINTITVVKYRRGEGLIEGTDCSVCLSEFREGEILRLLPKCNHAFHVGCIDTWLRSHTNCPMCRAYIVVSGIPGPSLASSDWSFGNLRRNEIDRVIDPEISEVELSNNDDVNEEFVGLGVDLNDQNKAEMSSEDGMKVVRRCVSMGYINSCAFIVLGDSGGLMPGPSWRFIKPLQGNEVSMRRCSSSGARLHDIHVRDSLLTK